MDKSALVAALRRSSIVVLMMTTMISAGCGGGGGEGEGSASTPSASSTAGQSQPHSTSGSPASAFGNNAPTIDAAPTKEASVGRSYVIAPKALDVDGDTLAFSIENKPVWAQFSTATGQLTGTPTGGHVGTYADVIISVSDGVSQAVLPPFTITVADTASNRIQAPTLQWEAPTETIDGAPAATLSGYRIHFGNSAEVLNNTIEVSSPATLLYVVDHLDPGTYYFAVRAVNADGGESALSNLTKIVVG